MERDNIVSKSIEQVMHESMMPYSEFVILDRALPRVEDGLKPVQRRVLYSMYTLGFFPDKPYKKSATIVGECMGHYHPHGDSSIYGTLVRLAQTFNMGEILVDGHGNFGSIDGDGSAAMRYTEAKLSPIALELLRDIDKDTVTWSFNFDDSLKEPDMLPSRYPNLLVNGSMGIAVGLATNIPTHNLAETIDLCCAYIDNRKLTTDEMMKIMPGPDFPTGGYILNSSNIKGYYETGKGKIILRAKLHIENADNGKKNIVITEIPYQVNKSTLLQKIAKLKENEDNGHWAYISDVVDESDRSGIRAVIKLKKDANVEAILALLYKNTDLQTTFNVNMVAIAGNKPKLMNVHEILEYYVNYQQDVVLRRTKFDLDLCEKKAHILEGLLIAINNIDEVIKIIKASASTTEAKVTLIKTFALSDVQAQAILDMRLSKLTNLEVNKLVQELDRLKMLIKRYNSIIKSPILQLRLVKEEMQKIKEDYPRKRATLFIDENHNDVEDVIENNAYVSETYSVITPMNTIKSVAIKNYNLATKELSSTGATPYEIPAYLNLTATNKKLYVFTNLGNVHIVNIEDIEQGKFKDKGFNLSSLIKKWEDNEKVVSALELSENMGEELLLLTTKGGMIKTTKVNEYFGSKQSIQAIKLKDSDELINVEIFAKEKRIALVTSKSMSVVIDNEDLATPTGRVSVGVKAIALSDEDYLVGSMQVGKDDVIALFSSDGYSKLIRMSELPLLPRNRKGLKVTVGKTDNSKLMGIYVIDALSNFVIETKDDLDYVYTKNIALGTRTSTTTNFKGGKLSIQVQNVYKYTIL